MLREFRIKDVAIIDDLTLQFGGGLNVITGETGAGKSILLRALGLLCGDRAGADLIRGSADEAIVEGVFEVEVDETLRESLALDPGEDSIIVRRHVNRNGKTRSYVNGAAATSTMLRDLSTHLVHIYGQHEQALLLRASNHLDYLDDFGGTRPQRRAMARAFDDLKEAQRRLDELDQHARLSNERRELLEFQRSELAAAAVQPGEEPQLRSDRERLRHAERIARACNDGEDALYSSSDAMVTRLARLNAELESLAAIAPDLSSPAELVEQGRLHLEEAALQLRAVATETLADPARLDEIEERIAVLTRTAKKYGVPSSELPAVLAAVEEELGVVQGHAVHRTSAADAVSARFATAAECAAALSRDRQQAGARLASDMQRELADLGMDGGVFRVAQETSPMRTLEDLGPSGADRVEFFLSANRGEAAQPLARVASGGELSRILLALKTLTAGIAETPILIFDEVDAGIGGSIADAVARKLRILAEGRQILCITHLPQIAAYADRHFAVSKRDLDGRTVSETRSLEGEERVAELSRMLGGASSSEAARYARELISHGRKAAPRATRRARPGA